MFKCTLCKSSFSRSKSILILSTFTRNKGTGQTFTKREKNPSCEHLAHVHKAIQQISFNASFGHYHPCIIKRSQHHQISATSNLLAADTAVGRPPTLRDRTVFEILKESFHFTHINEASLTPLPSYHDRNYYFCGALKKLLPKKETVQNDNSPYSHHDTLNQESLLDEFVLKINNPLFSSHEVLSGVNFVLNHLMSKGFNCVRPLTNKIGTNIIQIEGEDLLKFEDKDRSDIIKFPRGIKFPVRLLTYIPGEILADVDRQYLTSDLLYEVGKVMGSISKELHVLHVPALENRVLEDWDLMHFPDINCYVQELDDFNKRSMVDEVLNKFKQYVLPYIPVFRKGLIHGDANSYNIVLRMDPNGENRYRMGGVIDFDNCVSSCNIFDLAILLTYAMFRGFESEHSNPFEFVSPMLCGYVHAFPGFCQEEINSLLYLIMARCCQCVVIGNYSFKKEPWNTYLLTTHENCWKVLSSLLNTPKFEVDQMWDKALASTPASLVCSLN